MGPNKYVHLMFAIGGVMLAFILVKAGDWLWSLAGKPNDLALNGGSVLVAGLAAYFAYRNERVFAAAYDVTSELEKVTWPSRRETYAATIVVIVTVTLSSIIMWGFDVMWGALANLVIR